ncbi:MAG: TrbC/VirB2 family protein [Ralstonia sp.]|nr:TrbC/VirB2 family protein [Ralstonia sp.]
MLFAVFIGLFSAAAFAGSSGGLPWEGPLDTVVKSLTGPVALAISILAMAAAGGALVFGGDLSEFTRKIIMLVLAISFLVFGASFMSTVFGVSGALI